jgi:hypothetical protein
MIILTPLPLGSLSILDTPRTNIVKPAHTRLSAEKEHGLKIFAGAFAADDSVRGSGEVYPTAPCGETGAYYR